MISDLDTGISKVKHVILVSSGKGGVGKSTVAANLTASLHMQGHQVGLLDADIHGPSQLLMWGISSDLPMAVTEDGTKTFPQQSHGVSIVSMASRIKQGQAASWRGPMVTMALLNLLFHTQWGELDYLVVDMPPGTGDIQISICEKLPNAHVVIVTTPQPVALIDCRKGLYMYLNQKMNILGVVENMSGHACSHCGHVDHVFGDNGGALLASEFEIPLLAQIPLQSDIRQHADTGIPIVVADPHGIIAGVYLEISAKIKRGVS